MRISKTAIAVSVLSLFAAAMVPATSILQVVKRSLKAQKRSRHFS